MPSTGENMEELEFSYTVDENKKNGAIMLENYLTIF